MDASIVPAVKTMTVFLLICSVLIAITRGVTKAMVVRSTGLDDYLIGLSLLFTVGQSISTFFQAAKGNETHARTIDSMSTLREVKFDYTASLLYILSLLFAKLAVLTLIKTITPRQRERRATNLVAIFIIIWAMTGELAAALLCHVRTSWHWQIGQCSARHSFWSYLEVTNVITDLVLIALPFLIISKIQTSSAKKASTFSFFALRIGPFLDSVESGLIRSDDMRRRGSDYKLGPIPTGKEPSSAKSVVEGSSHGMEVKPSRPCRMVDIEGGSAHVREDLESPHSRTQIIRETRTFAVETFPDPDQNSERSDDVS